MESAVTTLSPCVAAWMGKNTAAAEARKMAKKIIGNSQYVNLRRYWE
jgi:hypothetical protein